MKLDKHPLAINVLKFQFYNFDFFSCQEIVLFETLVVVGGISFKKKDEFFHSTQTLSDKTGIKKHSIDKIIKRFDELNIINIKVKGMPRVKFFILNWDQIIELLPQIYQFDKFEEYFGESTQPLIDFYKQLAENDEKIDENTEEKNNTKNNKEEFKKGINYKVDVEENFKIMLKNVRYIKMTKEKFHLTGERFIEIYKMFNRHLVLRNDTKKTPKEYCTHFYFWYVKKFKINESTGKKRPHIYF